MTELSPKDKEILIKEPFFIFLRAYRKQDWDLLLNAFEFLRERNDWSFFPCLEIKDKNKEKIIAHGVRYCVERFLKKFPKFLEKSYYERTLFLEDIGDVDIEVEKNVLALIQNIFDFEMNVYEFMELVDLELCREANPMDDNFFGEL